MLAGEIDERMPAVTSGLTLYMPFDSRAGAFDGIAGNQSSQRIETGANLIEAMKMDWRDPNSWEDHHGMEWDETMQAMKVTYYHNTWLKTPIIVDTTKNYQVSIDIYEVEAPSSGLYLGGLCNNAIGQRVTPNFDYSYASNDNSPTGQWKTYRVTRTGTGNIVSQTSTSFSNISGWTGTTANAAITDKLTKYYYFGGLFNYSSTTQGVLYFRNPSVVVVDADTSNTTITNEGIAIEEQTTNGFTNPDWSVFGGYTDIIMTVINDSESFTGKTLKFQYPPGTFNDSARVTPARNASYTTGAFTVSFYAKGAGSTVGKSPKIYTGGASGWVTLSPPLTDKYQRYVYYDANFGAASGGFGIGLAGCVSNDVFYIHSPQIESKTFATAFTVGSRSYGALYLSKDVLNPSSFTVATWFKTSRVHEINTGHTGIQGNWYHPIVEFCPQTNQGVVGYSIAINPSANYTPPRNLKLRSPDVDSNFLIQDNTWYHIVGTFDGSTYKLYANGNEVLSTAGAAPAVYADSVLMVGGNYFGKPNGTYKDLCVYNRALSTDEVKKLYGRSFSISNIGSLEAQIAESTVGKPAGITYFDLGVNGMGANGTVSPVVQSDIVYEGGSVWVGKAITNKIVSQSSFGASGCTATYNAAMQEWTVTVAAGSTDNWRGIYYTPTDAIATPGSTHTLSFEVYADQVLPMTVDVNNGGVTTTTGTNDNDIIASRVMRTGSTKPGQWVKMSVTYTFDAALTQNFYLYDRIALGNGFVPSTNVVFKIRRIQNETSSFPSPFTQGTRAVGKLYYPTSLVNNTSWAFAFWAKVAAFDNEYNMPFDCYGNLYVAFRNTDRRLHFSFLNDGAQVGIYSPTNSLVANKWYHVAGIRTPTNTSMFLNGVQVASHTASGVGYVTTTDGDGYLHVGSYDTTYPFNGYIRDLIIDKTGTTLTAAKIQEMAKTYMRSSKNGLLQVGGKIIEGEVL